MIAFLSLLLAAPQAAQENHRAVFDKAADAVVAVRVMAALGERSGTGVILSKDGWIATSYSICPDRSERIRVYLRGPRLLEGRLVATSRELELSLIKVEPKGDLAPIEFGDSAAVRTGDVSYTLGNASNSIINNDSASLGVGVISALYTLGKARANSTYTGPVFETTAAVNVGMEGSPLLDAKGRMIGFVTLNYSPARFLGNAIPAAMIREAVDKLKKAAPAEDLSGPLPEAGPGWLGLHVVDRDGRVVVESVDAGSPAERKGLEKGVRLLAVGGRALKDAAEFQALQKELKEGDRLFLKVDDGSGEITMQIVLARKAER